MPEAAAPYRLFREAEKKQGVVLVSASVVLELVLVLE
jgi:hypothetical protein